MEKGNRIPTISNTALIIFAIAVLFYLWFHRAPTIAPAIGSGIGYEENFLLSPAYGTINRILYNGDRSRVLVTIFLSPLDIHQQFFPCDGTVLDQVYDDTGRFKIATDAQKSDENEKMIHTIQDKYGSIIKVTQIAGLVVRQISAPDLIGQPVSQGQYLGIIRLGSRVDIEFSLNNYQLLENIAVGTTVAGPNTRIAKMYI